MEEYNSWEPRKRTKREKFKDGMYTAALVATNIVLFPLHLVTCCVIASELGWGSSIIE